jgi:hypothetical protein
MLYLRVCFNLSMLATEIKTDILYQSVQMTVSTTHLPLYVDLLRTLSALSVLSIHQQLTVHQMVRYLVSQSTVYRVCLCFYV